jgi:hypothetical protein
MVCTLLVLLLCLLLGVPAQAQISIDENLSGTDSRAVPDGVNRYGEIEVTVVSSPVGGRQLFQMVSPTVYGRERPRAGRTPVEKRARDIEATRGMLIGVTVLVGVLAGLSVLGIPVVRSWQSAVCWVWPSASEPRILSATWLTAC